jgi:lysozyme
VTRKPIFAAVRKLLGRGLRQAEVALLDKAIDEAEGAIVAPVHKIGSDGLALIKGFEGCELTAYPDPGTGGDPWTIGWGATGPGIREGVTWTQAQADARLEQDLAKYAAEVADAVGDAPTSQQQFDALVSFHYNTGAIRRATLTKLHKAGDYAGAAKEFARWNRAGGRVLAGLTRRRAAEAALYRSGS